MAASHHRLTAGSPLLICLATGADDGQAWLATGQALERLLLTCTNEGLTASYLNQPVEIQPLSDVLREQLHLDAIPQLLLRVGHGPQIDHSPRRPIADVAS